MNQSNPSLLVENPIASGLSWVRTEEAINRSIDTATLGISLIELIGQLENTYFKARQQPQIDYIDESASTVRNMLKLLNSFTTHYLSGDAARQAEEEIEKSLSCSFTFDDVLRTRPFSNALQRVFWKTEETKKIQHAHQKLGESLIQTTTAILFQAIGMLGKESDLGHELDQSAVIFISELRRSW